MLLAAAACGGRAPAARWALRDSAGIRIVTTLTRNAPEWRLDTVPRLDLGTVTGGGPTQFFRVTSVRRMPDGGIVVVNSGSSQIRFFRADGSFVRSVGREGDGPGEFRALAGVWRVAGDSLYAWDAGSRRVSVFDARGDLVRSFTLGTKLLNGSVATVYPDGRVMTSDLYLDFPKEGPDKEPQPIWMRYALSDRDGATVDTLPRELNSMMVLLGQGQQRLIGTPLFGARTETAADARGYWVGLTKTAQILRYTPTGSLEEILRWPEGDRTVTKADVERAQEALLKGKTGQDAAFARSINATRPVADVFPSHGRLVARDDGELWVQEYERPGHTGGSRWMVFDTTGVLAARVTIPESFTLMEVGGDYVLGVYHDAMDVEHVRLYGLKREAGG